MPVGTEIQWGGSLHQSFRLLPTDRVSPNLLPFLDGDGLTPDELLARLPYDQARSTSGTRSGPDPKRYRDGRQIYQTAALLFENSGRVHLTSLGRAVRRWLNIINEKNALILGRHAAYALAACQLRNPTGAGTKYAGNVMVFPFAYIWRAMLALENRISSDELNRSLFKVVDDESLSQSIEAIRVARLREDPQSLGDETIVGPAKNDRIIPWVSLASFGWTLFPDKRDATNSQYYEIPSTSLSLIREAAAIRHRHIDFPSVNEYINHVAACAALPKDLR